MALGEKLTPEAKAELLDRLRAKYADEEPEPPGRWQTPDFDDPDHTPAGARGLDTLRRFFELLEVERPDWQADALCLEYPDVSFFPEKGESTEPAKAVCARCACQDECRSWAIEKDARHGIWAGESARTMDRSQPAA